MTLLYDGPRVSITQRRVETRVDGVGRPVLSLVVQFGQALNPTFLETLEAEVHHGWAIRPPGTVGVTGIETGAAHAELLLDPIEPDVIRLETLMAALAFHGSPLGSPLSGHVMATLCQILQGMHTTLDARGMTPESHGELHPGTVLLGGDGSIKLLGAGFHAVSALLMPRIVDDVARYRLLAPEAARGEPVDPRTDLYALGVLYYELLAGTPYRAGHGASAICQMAIEGRPPDLPGALPDPRPNLIELLGRMLAAQPDHRFSSAHEAREAITQELDQAGITPFSSAELIKMIHEFVPDGARPRHTSTPGPGP